MKKILNKVESKHFVICTHCGCHFTYDKDNIELIPLDNTNNFSRFVTCPCCSSYIKLLYPEDNQVKHIETLEL